MPNRFVRRQPPQEMVRPDALRASPSCVRFAVRRIKSFRACSIARWVAALRSSLARSAWPFPVSRFRDCGSALPARLMKNCTMRTAEPRPLGLTFLLAIVLAIVSASFVKASFGGKVETVFTLDDHLLSLPAAWLPRWFSDLFERPRSRRRLGSLSISISRPLFRSSSPLIKVFRASGAASVPKLAREDPHLNAASASRDLRLFSALRSNWSTPFSLFRLVRVSTMNRGKALYGIGALLVCFGNSWYRQYLGIVRSLATYYGSHAR